MLKAKNQMYVRTVLNDTDIQNGLLIANEGKSEYVIVRGENASESEITAALELQKYLKKITGVELPIVKDSESETEFEIIVGKTSRENDGEFDRNELKDDGFIIKTRGKKLLLVGGEQRGTLYSVYTFLEEYLGCRFYSPTVEKIPKLSTLIVTPSMPEDKQIPFFFYRDTYWYGSRPNNFNAKLKLNGNYHDTSEAYGGHIHGSIGHSFYELVPPSIYAADHPEYYSTTEGPGQLCFTNPEVVNIAIESIRKTLTEHPEITLMSIGQEDNSNMCTCDRCKKVLEEEMGMHSGVLLRFVNAIVTPLKDEFPNVMFNTFAYSWTVWCPKTSTKPADNLTIIFSTLDSCFGHPLRDNVKNDCIANEEWEKPEVSTNLPAWGEICNSIIVWDYTTNYRCFNAYFPNISVMLDNVRFFAENNVKGVFEQGPCIFTDTADFSELKIYLISKILWDPYMSEEKYQAYINEFLEDFYGPGWKHILEYMDFAKKSLNDKCFCIYEAIIYCSYDSKEVNPEGTYPPEITSDMIRNYEQFNWGKYTNWYVDLLDNEYLAHAEEFISKAINEAETDEQRTRLDKLSLQVDCVKSNYGHIKLNYDADFMKKILSAFHEANPNEFTDEEIEEYKEKISKLAREQADAPYIEFNGGVREKMLKHNITRASEFRSSITDLDKINLNSYPAYW